MVLSMLTKIAAEIHGITSLTGLGGGKGGKIRQNALVTIGYVCLILSLAFNFILWQWHLPDLRDRLAATGCTIPAEAALAKDMFKHYWGASFNLLCLWVLQACVLVGGYLASRRKDGGAGIFALSHVANIVMCILLGFMAHTAFYNKPAAAYDAAAAVAGSGCIGTFKGYRDTNSYASTFAAVSIIAAGLYIVAIVVEHVTTETENDSIWKALSAQARRGLGESVTSLLDMNGHKWMNIFAMLCFIGSFVASCYLFGTGAKSRDDAIVACTAAAAAATPVVTTPAWFNAKDDTNGYISTAAVFWANVVLMGVAFLSVVGFSEMRKVARKITTDSLDTNMPIVSKIFKAGKLWTTFRVIAETAVIIFWSRLLMQWNSHWLRAVFDSYGCTAIDVSDGQVSAWLGWIAVVVGTLAMEVANAKFSFNAASAAASLSSRSTGANRL